ncbi:TetR/AcrR family transcriptional regulator [Allopusillimonas ginsengisoli]|uniref:TetR/AcrR family transcriptional regulator n=1 Tax=Allopusillimonas ginsengisoli TaxID=453575 RepID=UPI001021BD2A|nr:TetR family transcriptional regulator [Allopusillimonas ginsengisoli]TEA77798.1 TetR family transcriptional regulator [Allopusillimonas ginsengisoli]
MQRARLTRQQSREQTRQRLLDAAHALFVQQGFGATSVEHITLAAGYSRGAFYSNFDSKRTIFLALLKREHERIMLGLHAILEDSALPAGAQQGLSLRAGMEARLLEYYAHIYKDAQLYTLWLEARLQASRDQEFRQHFKTFQQSTLGAVADFAEAFALRAGMTLTLSPQQLALGFMALCDGIGIYHLPGKDDAGGDENVEMVLKEFMTRIVFQDQGPSV